MALSYPASTGRPSWALRPSAFGRWGRTRLTRAPCSVRAASYVRGPLRARSAVARIAHRARNSLWSRCDRAKSRPTCLTLTRTLRNSGGSPGNPGSIIPLQLRCSWSNVRSVWSTLWSTHSALNRRPKIASNPRRQDPPRSHPLPQALPRPPPLPAPRAPTTGDLTNIEASLGPRGRARHTGTNGGGRSDVAAGSRKRRLLIHRRDEDVCQRRQLIARSSARVVGPSCCGSAMARAFSVTCSGVVAPKSTLATREFARANAIASAAAVVPSLAASASSDRTTLSTGCNSGSLSSWVVRRTRTHCCISPSARRRGGHKTRRRRRLRHRAPQRLQAVRRGFEARDCMEAGPRTAPAPPLLSRFPLQPIGRPGTSSRYPTHAPFPSRSGSRQRSRRSPRPKDRQVRQPSK